MLDEMNLLVTLSERLGRVIVGPAQHASSVAQTDAVASNRESQAGSQDDGSRLTIRLVKFAARGARS